MGDLLMPVNPSYTASWASHTRRNPPSTEAGTDMFVPIGTPVYSPADGRIYGYGATIAPMTGRWVGVDFDNGMRFRTMHLSRLVRTTGPVKRGDLLGYSGASGYGYEDWSHLAGMPPAHTHVTLWPTHQSRFGYGPNGLPYTIDFMNYVGGSPAGGGSTPEEDMNADQAYKLDRIFESVWTPAYGSKVDATINVVRNEAIPATARAVLFPNQPFNGFQALANNQTAMMEMIKALDPSKSADIEAFEVKLRESEARTIEATKQAVEASGSALRSEILAGLSGVEGVDPEIITSAVDTALDRVFVRTPGS